MAKREKKGDTVRLGRTLWGQELNRGPGRTQAGGPCVVNEPREGRRCLESRHWYRTDVVIRNGWRARERT